MSSKSAAKINSQIQHARTVNKWSNIHFCHIQPEDPLLPPGSDHANIQKTKYYLLKYILVSPTSQRTQHFLRSTVAINNQKFVQLSSHCWFIFHPFSKFRTFWEIFMSVVFSFAFFVIPYNVGFGEAMNKKLYKHVINPHRPLLFILRIINCACFIDIIINFFTGLYVNKTRTFIISPKKIANHYLLGYFWIDFPSSLPMDDILMFVISTEGEDVNMLILGECVGLLKIFRLKTFLRYIRQTCQMLSLGDTMQETIMLMLISFIFLHWAAVLHYVVACMVLTDDSWVLEHRVIGLGIIARYRNSLFRAVANMMRTGYGQGSPKELWDMCISLITIVFGALLRSYIIVSILHIYIVYSASVYKYQEMVNQLQSYMSHKQLPLQLQKNILTKFEFSYQKRYFREQAILATLPEHLRMEIKKFICRPLIESIDLFESLPRNVINDIIAALRREIYLPRDVIIRAGTRGDSMYFLYSGTVKVVSPIGKEIRNLVDGDYFGEIALVAGDKKRMATILAVDISEVYRLDRKDYEKCILPDIEAYEALKAAAAERLKQTLLEEEKYKMER